MLLNCIIVCSICSCCTIAILVMVAFNPLWIVIEILHRWRYAFIISKFILKNFIFFLLFFSLQASELLRFSIESHSYIWGVALVVLTILLFCFLNDFLLFWNFCCWLELFQLLFIGVIIIITKFFIVNMLIFEIWSIVDINFTWFIQSIGI